MSGLFWLATIKSALESALKRPIATEMGVSPAA
jgi:hypothetical protein